MRIQLGVIALFVLIAGNPVNADERPNIVFVLFDDMGWAQPSSYHAESKLRTPHFDRLASQGMRFTDAHSAAAVCTPTRYGLLTGRYPSRIGQFGVLTTYSKPIIPVGRTTVASLLKQYGYHTACVGKWHLGMNWIDRKPGNENQVPVGSQLIGGPNDIGFDYFCGFTHARNIGTVIEQDRVIAHVDPVDNQPLMLQKALAYIDERAMQGGPFFLYFPMCPPHTPVVPAAEFIGKSHSEDVVGKDPLYGDWVYQGDQMLGEIMQSLDKHGISDNTLLIATSDNGAAGRAYPPLRASKSSIYEGGHRVPYVVRWPERVKAASVISDTICLNDLMATVAELLGIELPSDAGEDSVSFLPRLLGTATSAARDGTIHQSPSGDLAIRQGAWKAIFHANGKRELFQLDLDQGEVRNVWGAHPEVAEKLTALLQSYIDRGRSTPGVDQRNDYRLALPKAGNRPARQK